jgi:hypothetical protein
MLLLLASIADADESWRRISVKSGVTYEKRAVSGSPYLEYRATTGVTAPPQRVRDAVWQNITGSLPATIKHRTVLRRTPTSLLVYDEIHAPVVSDRDVTLLIEQIDLGEGTFAVRFANVTDLGPAPTSAYVRLPKVRGFWMFAPDGAGGSRVSYTCYSEAGGSVPPSFVRGAQEDQIIADITRGLAGLR